MSHWGNIYVEEKYEVKNAGARHTGSFSRLKYAHSYNGKANSFRVGVTGRMGTMRFQPHHSSHELVLRAPGNALLRWSSRGTTAARPRQARAF